MELYLCRHGEYVKEEADPGHVLSPQGIADVTAMAKFLKSRGFRMDQILHSTKKRAQQTAEIMRTIINPDASLTVKDAMGPHDPIDKLLGEISQLKISTMIVGHLPFLPKLLSQLLYGDEHERNIAMPTSSVAVVKKDLSGKWIFDSLITVDSITS